MNFKLLILYYLLGFKISRLRYSRDWAELRNKRFRRLLNHLSASPFYKPYIKPGVSLSDFPVMDKRIFMDRFDDINTRGIRKAVAFKLAQEAENSRNFSSMIDGITVGLSSGTSGSRGIFLASDKERARWVACILDRVIGFSFRKRRVAFFLRANSNLYSSVQSSILEFSFFDLYRDIESNLSALDILQPHILVAQPSMLTEIARSVKQKKISISPEKIISVAEVLTPEDRKLLEDVFKQTIHQAYQCTEGFLAYTCPAGTLHFNEDFLIIEQKFLDHEKRRFHPVITDLLRTTQPVIRYELNDIITARKSCTCGSPWLAIEEIEGRSDDMLVFKNQQGLEVKLFPDFFRRAIISAAEDIENYAVIQKSPDLLYVYIKTNETDIVRAVTQSIQHLLYENDIRNVQINLLEEDPHQLGNKLRRIKNETHQAH